MKKILLVFVLVFLSFFYGLEVASKKIFPYEELVKLKTFLKNKTYKPQIVMFGDSITYGASWNEMTDDFKVLNKGINGLQSNELIDIVKDFDEDIKKAFIMIGINDFLNYKDVDDVYENYLEIIDILRKKNIKVFIISTLFVDKDINEIINQKVKLLNQKLQIYLYEENIPYINLNQKLCPNGYLEKKYTIDGIHLKKDAYDIWYKTIQNEF